MILRRKDNDLVIKGTIFPESTFVFATARRMLFCLQIRFLRVPKFLHRTLNRNVREDYNFVDVNLQRKFIFDSIRVLGIDQRAFNFKYKMVLSCARTTCSETNFSCCAVEACMFSSVVYLHGHEVFCRVVRKKTVFSEVISRRNNLFVSKLFLIKLNVWFVFKYGILAQPYFDSDQYSEFLVSLEKRRYRFEAICGGRTFQKKDLFSDFFTEPCIVFKGGFEIAEILSFIIS